MKYFIVVVIFSIQLLSLVAGWSTNAPDNSRHGFREVLAEMSALTLAARRGGSLLAVSAAVVFGSPDLSIAATGMENFQASCAGCHAGGGNTFPFSSKKTLFQGDLDKNGVNSVEVMSNLILKGKGGMPAYGEFMSQKGNMIPARFTEAEVIAISDFVLDQAEHGWK